MINDPLYFLNHKNFGIYSRPLAKALDSLLASVLLSELVEKRHDLMEDNKLYTDQSTGEGWFYYTKEDMEEKTTLSRKEQDSAIKILKDHELIETAIFGLPGKRHFRLNDEKIISIISNSKKHSRMSEMDKLDCPKRTNCDVQNGQTAHNRYIKNLKKENLSLAQTDEKDSSSHTASPIRAKDFSFSFDSMKFEGITKKDLDEWRQLYPNISLETEILRSEQWVKANPSKSNKKLWRKFLNTWFSKAQDKAFNQKAYQSFGNKVDRRTKNQDGSPVETPHDNLF